MTIAPDISRRPEFTIGDRLRKARTRTGLEVREFAAEIEVDRNTVTNYELERTSQDRMKPLVLRAWAMRCGVDYDWLVHGEQMHPDGGHALSDDSQKITVRYLASRRGHTLDPRPVVELPSAA